MKKIVILGLSFFIPFIINGQNKTTIIDSLRQALSLATEDTIKVSLLASLSWEYFYSDPDSAIKFGEQGLKLSKKMNYEQGESSILWPLAFAFSNVGDYTNALNYWYQSLPINLKLRDTNAVVDSYLGLATGYRDQGDYKKSIQEVYEARSFFQSKGKRWNAECDKAISETFEEYNETDSALFYANRANLNIPENSYSDYTLGSIYWKKGKNPIALGYFRRAVSLALKHNNQKDLVDIYNGFSKLFWKERKTDSAIYYANLVLGQRSWSFHRIGVLQASRTLADIYENLRMPDSALKYLKQNIALGESIFSQTKTREAQSFAFNEQLHQQELAMERERSNARLRMYAMVAVAGVILMVAFFLYRSNLLRKRSFVILKRNAREAVKQAVLDRIRADIASMRTVADLDKITPLIWEELTKLGIPFVRCGVFIMDEAQQLMHTFLSTPEGKAIAAFHLPFSTRGNLSYILQHWLRKRPYLDCWDDAGLTEVADVLLEQGAIGSREEYLSSLPKGGIYLHCMPFLQGMLYVGNTSKLSDDEIELIQSVADAFSTAYSRYEDFNKIEEAKKQVETTLQDLKQAQQQLVQSEKMASLGELTAGIAHEIQNPLNFVNNFSDLNKEMLAEMKVLVDNGNLHDARAIMDDLAANEAKINHHGRRAEAIVKGMLQHSRQRTFVKEPTDINKLVDEYLKLSYHGLRAKEQDFSAKFETNFDSGIGKINVVAQDIGRVLLNLINNAFFAVNQKRKIAASDYDPKVNVSTKLTTLPSGLKAVSICVRDNGSGIPKSIIDKVFQPFFTTKPTGQGTGLGLSLSYDIVKAHGGEIKVETKEGEATEFIVVMPIN